MELLSIMLQVIMTLVEGLLELNELLSLHGDFVVVTETHVELLVFDTLSLLWQQGIHVLFEIFLVFCLEHLQSS